MTRRLCVAVALALLAACSVDRSALDEDVFACRRDADCIAGYGCQLVDAVGHGFCAQSPDDAGDCDGFVTGAGLCLAECDPGDSSCGPDLSCLSTDIVHGDAGYCAPVDPCSSDADCSSEEVCMDHMLDDFVDLLWGPRPFPATAALSCVPRCGAEGQCPAGTECLDSFAESLTYCLPRCGDDSECPLGFGCWATAGTSIGVCIPGVPGLDCQDDSNCLAGVCTTISDDSGSVAVCASPCDASVSEPICGTAEIEDGRLNVLACTTLPDDGGDYCLFRPGYLHRCEPNFLGPGVSNCAPGLDCMPFDDGNGGSVNGCARACTFDPGVPNQDRDGDCSENAFCFRGSAVGLFDLCLYDLPDGSVCGVGDQCASRICDPTLSCADDGTLGCCVPS